MERVARMDKPLDADFLKERAREAWKLLEACSLCPRACGVDRVHGQIGFCRIGANAVVSSAFPHFGEERCISGIAGSGTIFFSGCNLGCIFCQNYSISQGGEGEEMDYSLIARLMLGLQQAGCHNLNLVTPSHIIPQILDALALAAKKGFRLPIVYNSGGYDSLAELQLLDGVVDIYMPDFKYWESEAAERLSGAKDYPEIARRAIKEMHRQVGDLIMDENGIAKRGLLVRHLVLPNGFAGTKDVFRFLIEEISPCTHINVMGQYHPCWKSSECAEIDRPMRYSEILEAKQLAKSLHLV
ncbi:MAG: radical SAM protein [Candidatus Omnitrophota bacterium]